MEEIDGREKIKDGENEEEKTKRKRERGRRRGTNEKYRMGLLQIPRTSFHQLIATPVTNHLSIILSP